MVKADSYATQFLGGGSDGSEIYGHFGNTHLTPPFADSLYVSNSIVRRIVDTIPETAIAAGFHIDGIDDEGEFWSKWDYLNVNESISDAWSWARLFGGSAIVAIVKDNRALTSPVREGAELESLRVYDRSQVKVQKKEENPRNVRFGKPLTYRITPEGSSTFYDVHYSRVHIMDGEKIPSALRRGNDGWGASVLVPDLLEAIKDYQTCEKLATQLLRRKQQAVWKAKGLTELCDDAEGFGAARLRLAQVDDNSGVGRAIGIDAEAEEYSVLNSDIGGIDGFLDKKFDRIVALSGIHEIILKGRNVGGVSSSQNTALETFHKLIDRKRNEELLPVLGFLIPFITTEQEWSVEFNPLAQESKKDRAEILKDNVDSIAKLIENGVMDTDEARDTLRALAPEVKISEGSIETEVTVNEGREDPLEVPADN